ncbi:hypothetical protein C8R45DRAFT_238994 [Mycena sanguinolenta]|nr:hypothetical protein C8R45DRAFT_238994 [Mycena sanguinolenta]
MSSLNKSLVALVPILGHWLTTSLATLRSLGLSAINNKPLLVPPTNVPSYALTASGPSRWLCLPAFIVRMRFTPSGSSRHSFW